MILLRLISWPYFRRHLLRTVLTVGGVVLGVALFVGMRSANQNVLGAFSRTIDRIAGRAQLQVTAGDTGFGEDVLDRVQAASSVFVAVPVIEAVVDSHIRGLGSLLVLGIDMTGDRRLRDYDLENDGIVDDPLIFLAQPDSLIVSSELQGKAHVAVGGHLTLGTSEGDRIFTVRGVMKSSGLATAFGGNIAVMDIYAAQKMFGRGRTFDRIDLAVKPGTTVAQAVAELTRLLGAGFEIQPPAARGAQVEGMLASYTTMVGISSAFALFVGMFIIYNAFSIAVTERRKEIGILRSLGASRAQIQRLFIGESAALGLVGSIVGVLVGTMSARAIAAFLAPILTSVYGVAQSLDEAPTSLYFSGLALAVGLAVSVVAAMVPALNAARVDPVLALQKGKNQELSGVGYRRRGGWAAVLFIFALLCLFGPRHRFVFYLGYATVIVATVLASPILSLSVTRVLRRALAWLQPIEGALAADSLMQAPKRTSSTVAALMLSLALVVAFQGMTRAEYASIMDWVSGVLNPDLFVLPTASIDNHASRLPATMGEELAAVQGVSRVQWLRNGRIWLRGSPVMLSAMEMKSIAETVHTPPVAGGDQREMFRKAAAGEGVIVSDSLAQLQHLRLGEDLVIPAPYGEVRLPIVGVTVDYTDQNGTIFIDRHVFTRYWHDDWATMFRVYTGPGLSAAVRERILGRYAGQRQVFVLTNSDLRAYVVKLVSQWFGLTTIQIAVAVLIAILGIVNSLTVSITDRQRELGVLRAVGGLHNQIRRTIWLEAVSIGAVGLVLGCGLGAVNLYYVLQVVQRDIAGVRLDYQFPVATALGLIPIILGAAFAAALWPAERAVRRPLVEALEYE
jgi:putative ABC transport system permease protein